MGFLGKLFGNKKNVSDLQRAVDQKRYADAYYLADELNDSGLSENEVTVVERLRAEAGDGLARLNLVEAVSKLQSNEPQLAEQHFDLALQYVSSPELKKEIEQSRYEPSEIAAPADNTGSVTGCASCAPGVTVAAYEPDHDETIQLELILSSYPSVLKKRYEDRSRAFVEAFLASQQGDNVHSCELFKNIKKPERDDIYWFEVGSLLARMGNMAEARDALMKSLEQNPDLMLAVEALVEVLMNLGEIDVAVALIQGRMTERAEVVPQCHALLATVSARQEDWKTAAGYVQSAVDGGFRDPTFISLAAMVMEKIAILIRQKLYTHSFPPVVAVGGRGICNWQSSTCAIIATWKKLLHCAPGRARGAQAPSIWLWWPSGDLEVKVLCGP